MSKSDHWPQENSMTTITNYTKQDHNGLNMTLCLNPHSRCLNRHEIKYPGNNH